MPVIKTKFKKKFLGTNQLMIIYKDNFVMRCNIFFNIERKVRAHSTMSLTMQLLSIGTIYINLL